MRKGTKRPKLAMIASAVKTLKNFEWTKCIAVKLSDDQRDLVSHKVGVQSTGIPITRFAWTLRISRVRSMHAAKKTVGSTIRECGKCQAFGVLAVLSTTPPANLNTKSPGRRRLCRENTEFGAGSTGSFIETPTKLSKHTSVIKRPISAIISGCCLQGMESSLRLPPVRRPPCATAKEMRP